MTDVIQNTVNWLKNRGVDLPSDILLLVKDDIDLTNDDKEKIYQELKSVKQIGGYQGVRNEFWAAVYDAVSGYLTSTVYIPTYKDPLIAAISKAYLNAANIGYEEGGGTLPLDEDTALWVRSELDAQFGFIDSLFLRLKELRKEDDVDFIGEAFSRADGYANSLDMLYNGAKLAGAGNKMLTFDGDDGKESCKDCRRYKGQRHRASWWKSHGAIPPNRDFECHGYNCQHVLVDDDGKVFTL
jgi:hypothetical protein